MKYISEVEMLIEKDICKQDGEVSMNSLLTLGV
jgi:hypothetical protein